MANLHRANLTGADLRAANLTGADLRKAILTDTRIGGANLRSCVVEQHQLDAARGGQDTKLAEGFHRPDHWHSQPPREPDDEFDYLSDSPGPLGNQF